MGTQYLPKPIKMKHPLTKIVASMLAAPNRNCYFILRLKRSQKFRGLQIEICSPLLAFVKIDETNKG